MYLSPRQYEIVRLLVDGYTQRAVAHALGLSLQTVKNHLYEARHRVGVETTAQVMVAVAEGRAHDVPIRPVVIGADEWLRLKRRVTALEALASDPP